MIMSDPASINSRRLIAINSGVKYVALVVINLLTFFLTPYLIRTLGPTLLGLKTLAYQALQFVGLAHTAMGISYERYAKVNYARGDFEELNSNLSAGLLVSAVSAFLFAAGSVVLAIYARQLFGLPEDIVPVARRVFLLIGFTTAFLILTGVWETPVFVTERFYLLDLGNLLCSVLAAALVVVIFECWRPSIVLWVLLSNGLLVVWRAAYMMPMARRLLPSLRLGFSLIKSSGQVRELMAFGGLNFVGGIGYLLYYASDSIMISNLNELGPGQIVYYNLAQRWDPQIRVLVMAFVGSMLPLMTSLVSLKDEERLKSIFLRGTRYSLLIGAWPALLLILMAKPFLAAWVGDDFARISAPVMQLLMIQFLICLPERMAYNVNIAHGRMGGPVVVSLLCGALNIVVSVALAKYAGWGLMGIAAGSALAMLIVCWYSICYALRLMHVSLWAWFQAGCLRAMLCTLPMVVTLIVVQIVWRPDNLLVVFIQFGLGSLAYAAGVWSLGLTDSDREQVGQLWRRLLTPSQRGFRHD